MHASITAKILEILQTLLGICLTYYRIECCASISLWVVKIYQYFWVMFIHILSYDVWKIMIYIVLHNSAITSNEF